MINKFNEMIYSDITYKPEDINDILEEIKPLIQYSCINTKHKYIDLPCAFDIETSSFFHSSGKEEKEKVAVMYEWTFGILGYIIIGRTWKEFKEMILNIYLQLELFNDYRLVIYVHNLGYEFQFMRKHFEWESIFANKNRQPIYALTTNNIEFRCSYLLSGYRLEIIGEELDKYKIKKLVGNLDYNKIRSPETPLTDKELSYCINDVKVVMCYIVEKLLEYKTISNIPLTKTGFVRRYVRNKCFYEDG